MDFCELQGHVKLEGIALALEQYSFITSLPRVLEG